MTQMESRDAETIRRRLLPRIRHRSRKPVTGGRWARRGVVSSHSLEDHSRAITLFALPMQSTTRAPHRSPTPVIGRNRLQAKRRAGGRRRPGALRVPDQRLRLGGSGHRVDGPTGITGELEWPMSVSVADEGLADVHVGEGQLLQLQLGDQAGIESTLNYGVIYIHLRHVEATPHGLLICARNRLGGLTPADQERALGRRRGTGADPLRGGSFAGGQGIPRGLR